MKAHGFSCPHCGSADVRRSRRHGLAELPAMLIGIYPFRCLGCGSRFHGNVWLLSTYGYANCPKCLRLDLLPSTKRDSQLTGRERLLMKAGAHMHRCVACRHNFLSFRRRLNSGLHEIPATSTGPDATST